MDFNTIAQLRRYLAVKHHVPGRIRIKFSTGILSDKTALQLVKGNDALPPAVKSVRRNLAARSVVIEYDAERIPPELLEKLATTRDDEVAADLVATLHALVTEQ